MDKSSFNINTKVLQPVTFMDEERIQTLLFQETESVCQIFFFFFFQIGCETLETEINGSFILRTNQLQLFSSEDQAGYFYHRIHVAAADV